MKNSVWVSLLLLAGASGCLKRVPKEMVEKLPYEAKIEMLEAENDLALAVDRLDEAKAEVQRAEQNIRRGKARASEASSEVSNANDAISKEVAQLAVNEAEARIDWLKAKRKVVEREEAMAQLGLVCAQARYEQARLAITRKAKIEGSESLDPAAFEAQVKTCEQKLVDAKTASKETTDAEATARANWDKTKQALAKKTFDARASPWVE